MDALRLQLPAEKVTARLVDGKLGQAVRLDFADDCQNVYVQTRSSGTPQWNEMEGFSFWVKGDGSDHLGGIEFVWNGDYALRYAYAFPIDSDEWRKITVRWRDLVPETSNAAALPIDPKRGNAPSKLVRDLVWQVVVLARLRRALVCDRRLAAGAIATARR